jgi:beta-glucosidase
MNSIRLLLLGILTSATLCRAFAHSAIDAAPRTDKGWQDRQTAINAQAAAAGGKAQVVFIGDSITQGWEGEGKAVWAHYYAHRNAVNLGIGGDRTQHVLWRLDNGNLTGLSPKAAVVMIGTNNSNGEDNSVEQIAEGVAAIVHRLREKLPDTKILLVAIFPRGENPNAQRGKVLQVNEIIRRQADGKSVYWADIGHLFIDDKGVISREIMPDYLHLTPKGYTLWAEAIEDQLSQLIGDQRVSPGESAGGPNLSGDWVATMEGSNGNTIETPFTLKQEGSKLSGSFVRGNSGKSLEIENGKISGNDVSWTVKRDRPDGTTIVYEINGKVEGNKIAGHAKTKLDGNDTTREWNAVRK